MICSIDELNADSALQCDLCVVGAGPAGILIALRAAESGARVIVLESGGLRPDAASQALCAGEVANPDLHPPTDTYRRRGLGGSTTIWGGRCVPFDPLDFAPRPWLDLPSCWPITYDAVVPFWRQAHTPAELGRYDYSARTALPGGMRPMFDDFASPEISTDHIERFSCPTDFGAANTDRLARDKRIQVLLHATCTNIALTDNLRTVTHLDVATRGKQRLRVRARTCVLACGGLEVPRLLLASRSQIAAGVGNAHDLVGRYYMCHLAATLGLFTPAPGCAPWHGYEQVDDGVYCRRRLTIKPSAQQAHRIGNVIARLHHLFPADPSHRTGALSALYLARRILPYEYRRRFAVVPNTAGFWPHVRNVVADPFGTARFAEHSVRRRFLATRKFPSIIIAPRSGAFTLDVHAEQLPNAESRVRLARTTDLFGTPQLHIDWRYRPEDLRTVSVGMGLMAGAFAAGGHGTLAFDRAEIETSLRREGAYGGHHLGTARMSASPRKGVVDADCRVHDMDNLFVAGGAVFATSGQANPTLTILALALRLADHLKPGLRDRVERSVPVAPECTPLLV